MRQEDKIKVANWLRRQVEKLEALPHYQEIKDRVVALREAIRSLEEDIYGENQKKEKQV